MLVIRRGGGGRGPAELQLRLQVQETSPVVGLPGGALLQEALLVHLPIFCHLTLGGVGLAKRLQHRPTPQNIWTSDHSWKHQVINTEGKWFFS